MDERKSESPDESLCHRLGDLAARATPDESRLPDARQWARIEASLGPSHASLRRLLPALSLALLLVGGLSSWLWARRGLAYQVQDCALAGDGGLSARERGTILFEDGTRVDLAKSARLRVRTLAYGRGAKLFLDDGAANLAVVHRDKASWAVLAGPFRVDVTGTRFLVRWSRASGRFQVTMSEGEVRVSGPRGASTFLRAGQTLQADAQGSRFEILPAEPAPSEPSDRRNGPAASSTDVAVSPPRASASQVLPGPRARPASALSRRRADAAQAIDLDEKGAGAGVVQTIESSPAGQGPRQAPALEVPPQLLLAPEESAPKPIRSASGPTQIAIGQDGKMNGGQAGAAWVARGEGVVFSSPLVQDERGRLRCKGDLFCVSGRIAGLSCVNPDTPRIRCNWDRNWGVALGFHVRADEQAWGDSAPSAIALEYHGRSSNYRLHAHRKNDPSEKTFCVENYKSGQPVRPSMFKTACWDDQGESLSDFRDVDLFNLQFPSQQALVAFHYCLSGITLYP